MIDRDNKEDIYNVVLDDFNWIKEDITKHQDLLKEDAMKFLKEDRYDDSYEIQQQCQDIKKIINLLNNIKNEYISIIKDVDDKVEENIDKVDISDEFIENNIYNDWTDKNIEKIILFGKTYDVKYWRKILIILLEELIKIDNNKISRLPTEQNFKGRTRNYFTYDKDSINSKHYKTLSNGLFVLVNMNANSIVSLCYKILNYFGFENKELIIKVEIDEKDNSNEIENDQQNNVIKLSKKYASIINCLK